VMAATSNVCLKEHLQGMSCADAAILYRSQRRAFWTTDQACFPWKASSRPR
jgi:hypothetical protein